MVMVMVVGEDPTGQQQQKVEDRGRPTGSPEEEVKAETFCKAASHQQQVLRQTGGQPEINTKY